MPIKPEDAKITAQKAYMWFKQSRDAMSKAHKEADTDCEYYDGDQWSNADKEELKKRGQPAITFNIIKSTMDLVLGTEKRMRVDYKAFPKSPAHVEDANVATNLMKQVMDQCQGEFVSSDAFEHMTKSGWTWIDVAKNRDPFGEPMKLALEEREFVFWDRYAKEYDLNDGKYIGRAKWLELEDAIALFPEYEEELKAAIETDALEGYRKQPYEQTGDDIDPHGSVFDWEDKDIKKADWIDKGRKRVRLLEVQYKVPVQILILINNETGEKEEFNLKSPESIMKLMEPNVEVKKATIKKVRVAIIAGPNVIQDKWSIYCHNRYTLVPFWCYRKSKSKEPYGMIRQSRDPQTEVNKRRSKALHILNALQVIADDGAVDDVEEARSEIARPDAWIAVKEGKKLEVNRDTQLADAQMALEQEAKEMIHQTSGIIPGQLGWGTEAKSGKQEQIKISQANVMLATIFDNYRRSRQIVGELLFSGIQQFYTTPMIVRVLDQKGDFSFITINERLEDDEGNGYIRNDIARAKVDIKIDEEAYHETVMESVMEQMMALAAKLPPEVSLMILDLIISYSHLPGRDEMVRRIQQIQQTMLGPAQPTAEAGTATA